MITAGWFGLIVCGLLEAAPASSTVEAREVVVLVHGMGRTHYSMRPVETALAAAGFDVINHRYPSRRRTVQESGEALAAQVAALESRDDVARIHMVGHSLGNIVIRWVAANRRPAKIGRIVMLAPPNQGAHLADRFAPWLSWLSEPLADLTTAETSAARMIPTPPGLEIGIIAGSLDRTVRVPETMLVGQKEQIVVSSGHTFIMRKPLVHHLIVHFLRHGTFLEAPVPIKPCQSLPGS